jgi:hypothetical protein
MGYSQGMVVQINESALKHGVIMEDIHRAMARKGGSYHAFHAMVYMQEYCKYAERGNN